MIYTIFLYQILFFSLIDFPTPVPPHHPPPPPVPPHGLPSYPFLCCSHFLKPFYHLSPTPFCCRPIYPRLQQALSPRGTSTGLPLFCSATPVTPPPPQNTVISLNFFPPPHTHTPPPFFWPAPYLLCRAFGRSFFYSLAYCFPRRLRTNECPLSPPPLSHSVSLSLSGTLREPPHSSSLSPLHRPTSPHLTHHALSPPPPPPPVIPLNFLPPSTPPPPTQTPPLPQAACADELARLCSFAELPLPQLFEGTPFGPLVTTCCPTKFQGSPPSLPPSPLFLSVSVSLPDYVENGNRDAKKGEGGGGVLFYYYYFLSLFDFVLSTTGQSDADDSRRGGFPSFFHTSTAAILMPPAKKNKKNINTQ